MGANSIVCVAGSLILHHQSWSPVVATRFTLITFWFRLKAIRTRPTSIPTIAIFIIIIIIMLITFWFRWKVIRTRAPHLCDHITFSFRGSEVLFLLLPKMADLGYQKMGLRAPKIKTGDHLLSSSPWSPECVARGARVVRGAKSARIQSVEGIQKQKCGADAGTEKKILWAAEEWSFKSTAADPRKCLFDLGEINGRSRTFVTDPRTSSLIATLVVVVVVDQSWTVTLLAVSFW